MDTHPPSPDAPVDPEAETMAYNLEVLSELVEYARAMAGDVVANLPKGSTEQVMAFDRVARCIRMTIAMKSRMALDWKGGRAGMGRPLPKLTRPCELRVKQRLSMQGREDKARIETILSREIRAGERDPVETENLLRDMHERLDDPSIERELGNRPFLEIFLDICGGLGLTVEVPVGAGETKVVEPGAPGMVRASRPGDVARAGLVAPRWAPADAGQRPPRRDTS
jgi:hypothetical protein